MNFPDSFPALFFAAVLVASLTVCLAIIFRQQQRISALLQDRSDLLREEKRLLDFSHELGEVLKDDIRATDLHRQIVEGVVRISDASGGMLYIAEKGGKILKPGFVTPRSPILSPLPPAFFGSDPGADFVIDREIRLRPLNAGEGPLGIVYQSGQPFFGRREEMPGGEFPIPPGREPEQVMIAPLIYAGNRLGVLAVATIPGATPFVAGDFAVFKSISEQAAFALHAMGMFGEAQEKRRMENDLDLARDIQRILLPEHPPTIPGYDFGSINIPARQVSGDYLDFITVGNHLLGIAVADVSGKGFPAALIMAMCRSVLRSYAPGNPSAADVLRRVNRQLYPDIREDMFISMLYMVLDHRTRELTIARAGHDAPVLCDASGKVTRLDPSGMALGIDRGDVFDRVTVNLQIRLCDDEALLLFTDGITEALNRDGEEFGVNRLIELFTQNRAKPAEQIVETIGSEVKRFCSNTQQHDDITMIAIKGVHRENPPLQPSKTTFSRLRQAVF